jgi:transaldolase
LNNMERLAREGQSLWLDFIRRDWLMDGRVARHIEAGLRGMTSNPTIFEQAIDSDESGSAYDAEVRRLVREQPEIAAHAVYDALTWEDIRRAADLFLPVYQRLDADDGYVSVEVSPLLARDTEGTIREAHRIWDAIAHPNVMIKVPATKAGLPAIRQLLADGLNVNVTLIFSVARYREVMAAHREGLEARHAQGLPLDRVRSVASFFVSRMDTLVDRLLDETAARDPARTDELSALKGRAAVANAKLAYREFQRELDTPAQRALAAAGARPQRPLWASTSTKNPSYPDLLYVEPLVGPDTVNTVPPKTLEAILDHARVSRTVDRDVEQAEADTRALEAHGIDLDAVTSQLEVEGVRSFERSFETLMAGIEQKIRRTAGAHTGGAQ